MPRLKGVQFHPWGDTTVAYGFIYDDEKGRFVDGTFVHTSPIVDADPNLPPQWIQTRNTRYELEYVEEANAAD